MPLSKTITEQKQRLLIMLKSIMSKSKRVHVKKVDVSSKGNELDVFFFRQEHQESTF